MIILPKGFQYAKKALRNSTYKIQVGSSIMYKGKFISSGYNTLRTHPKFANGKNSFTLHAECSAIINSKCDLTGSSIYVYREYLSSKLPALSKPCDSCLAAILEASIKYIYWSINKYPYYEVIKLY